MSEDIEKAEEMLKEIDEAEEKAAKAFNIDDFLVEPNKTYEVNVKGMGIVKFQHLTIGDITAMQKAKNFQGENADLCLLYLMLHKADSTITFEKVKRLPPKIYTKLFDALKPLDFL